MTTDIDAKQDRHVCERCGEAYPAERLLVLHRGVRHPDDLDAGEVEAYREAYYEEERELKSFRIRALGVLVALYFGFLILFILFAS
ncbi:MULTISPECIES: DNA-binding protein [Haloferax]|uniref:DNA-binding protein n=1 Tax=Haloferax marinum TaxID=2666143 RepID=A0A6A8GBF8_9EURY|nr:MULTISPECIES: DNA-binding protein [Haloferax]KAB1191195.1 DNA-binding protein [Haloferax sp. CBA1150]MRW98085.1 DNA-binding protein [Haloferax marinum]